MIKHFIPFILFLPLFFVACEHDHDEHNASPGPATGEHLHPPPHGGMLVELGEHGSGYQLELFLHEQGYLQIYVWDTHVDNLVRIAPEKIEVLIPDANGTQKTLVCDAMSDPITGETVGNTALFNSTEKIGDKLPLNGVIPSLQILSQTYENISFEFPGNSAVHEDDH
jgi:hypothetical protein